MFGVTGFFVEPLFDLYEPVLRVETARQLILLEHTEFEVALRLSDVVQQSTAHPLSVIVGIDEDAADLVAEDRDESQQATIDFIDPCFGHREPLLNDLVSFFGEKLLAQEGVADK